MNSLLLATRVILVSINVFGLVILLPQYRTFIIYIIRLCFFLLIINVLYILYGILFISSAVFTLN